MIILEILKCGKAMKSNKEEIQSRRQREQDFVRNCKKNILHYSRVTPGGDTHRLILLFNSIQHLCYHSTL